MLSRAMAGSLVLGVVSARAQEKSTSQKASEAWTATKETTKDVTKKAVSATKRAANKVEAAIEKPDADARKVEVTVNDRGVQMPNNLPAGKTAFIVRNTGKQAHNFEVEGSGIDKSFWIALPPNESKTMQVDLKPGTYEGDCKLHEGKEAKVRLTVK
jgi:iron uptake system component EfeO